MLFDITFLSVGINEEIVLIIMLGIMLEIMPEIMQGIMLEVTLGILLGKKNADALAHIHCTLSLGTVAVCAQAHLDQCLYLYVYLDTDMIY